MIARPASHWPVAVATMALVLVALLALQNQSLKADLEDLRYRSVRSSAGEYVPSFGAVTMAGDTLQVVTGRPGASQVLAMFTTTCASSRASIPAWNRLADLLAARGSALIGIALDSKESVQEVRGTWDLRFPVVEFPDEPTRRMYRGGWVPATIVVDGEGGTLYVRMGTLEDPAHVDSILRVATASRSAAASISQPPAYTKVVNRSDASDR